MLGEVAAQADVFEPQADSVSSFRGAGRTIDCPSVSLSMEWPRRQFKRHPNLGHASSVRPRSTGVVVLRVWRPLGSSIMSVF